MAAKTRSRPGALGTTSARVGATAARVSTTAAHVVAVAGRKLRVNAHSKTRRKLQTLTVAVSALALLAGCGPSQPRVAVAPTATYKAEVVRDMPTTPAGWRLAGCFTAFLTPRALLRRRSARIFRSHYLSRHRLVTFTTLSRNCVRPAHIRCSAMRTVVTAC